MTLKAKILTSEPKDEKKCREFGLIADSNQTHETDGDYVLDYREEVDVEMQNCDEHENG